jgi:osmotically-inducible protein OsmY
MVQLSKLACALFVAAVLITGCNRAPDPGDQVREALRSANIEDVNVNYDSDSKAIHLTGSVDSPADKQRAEEVATRAVGTSGSILNELTVEGPAENRVDDLDGTIRDRLNEMIQNDPMLKDRDVNFDVNNGAVEIKGSVASDAEKARVGEMVRSVQGVKDAANGLEVHPDDYSKRPASPANQ